MSTKQLHPKVYLSRDKVQFNSVPNAGRVLQGDKQESTWLPKCPCLSGRIVTDWMQTQLERHCFHSHCLFFGQERLIFLCLPHPNMSKPVSLLTAKAAQIIICPLEVLLHAGWQNTNNLMTQTVIRACLNFHTRKDCASAHKI